MSGTASSSVEPGHLTIRYTENEDGWITAEIVEVPEAISQGSSQHEARVNVVEALHDLIHASHDVWGHHYARASVPRSGWRFWALGPARCVGGGQCPSGSCIRARGSQSP